MMVEKNNTFPGLARFNALGARGTIIKFKQGGDFIFPQTIYYIIHSRTRIQIYIIQKIQNRGNAISRTRDLLSDEGETFFGILSHFRDTLCHGGTQIGGWWCGYARSTTTTADATTSCCGFLMLTRSRKKKLREQRIYFFLYT